MLSLCERASECSVHDVTACGYEKRRLAGRRGPVQHVPNEVAGSRSTSCGTFVLDLVWAHFLDLPCAPTPVVSEKASRRRRTTPLHRTPHPRSATALARWPCCRTSCWSDDFLSLSAKLAAPNPHKLLASPQAADEIIPLLETAHTRHTQHTRRRAGGAHVCHRECTRLPLERRPTTILPHYDSLLSGESGTLSRLIPSS